MRSFSVPLSNNELIISRFGIKDPNFMSTV